MPELKMGFVPEIRISRHGSTEEGWTKVYCNTCKPKQTKFILNIAVYRRGWAFINIII